MILAEALHKAGLITEKQADAAQKEIARQRLKLEQEKSEKDKKPE